MQTENRTEKLTRVSVLGTLAEFHREPIPYDLQALVQLVADLKPDFVCLEMTPEQWQRQDFDDLPPEYREALLPLAYQTDMVVVPIAEARPPTKPTASGWRGWFIGQLRRGLALIVRNAPNATAMNQGWRHDLANLFYHLIDWLAGPQQVKEEWQAYRHHLAQQVLELARRDPGRRILVVVNVRHCHHIRPVLAGHTELEEVSFSQL